MALHFRHPYPERMKAFLGLILAVLPGLAGVQADDRRVPPVLVELFTSQSCSSCPPADQLAGRLSQRDDVVVLSFHVNYWDYVGWTDPFATEATTARQFAYARSLRQRGVYTPEMVIGGRAHVVGSDEAAVQRAIERQHQARRFDSAPSVGIEEADGRLWVGVGAAPYDGTADVILVHFDSRRDTHVTRGENRGRALSNFNVVRGYTRLGAWRGTAARFPIDEAERAAARGNDGCAVIVQERGVGPVVSAAAFAIQTPTSE